MSDLVSWEQLQEKKYYITPTDPDWEKIPAGLRLFHDDPENNPLGTPSGKLEFYSQRLADHFPDDEERPPSPKWIEKGPSHDERLSSERAKKYPLLMVSNHAEMEDARPERRHHLAAGDRHLQGQGLGRVHVRARLDQPR